MGAPAKVISDPAPSAPEIRHDVTAYVPAGVERDVKIPRPQLAHQLLKLLGYVLPERQLSIEGGPRKVERNDLVDEAAVRKEILCMRFRKQSYMCGWKV